MEALSACLRWKGCSGSKMTAKNPGRSATSCYGPLGFIMCQRVKPRSVMSASFSSVVLVLSLSLGPFLNDSGFTVLNLTITLTKYITHFCFVKMISL